MSILTLQQKIQAIIEPSIQDGYLSYDTTEPWRKSLSSLMLDSSTINDFGEYIDSLFHEKYQCGTLEVSGVALTSALVVHLASKTKSPVNGFFIRKSRKKKGLLRMVEGTIIPHLPVVLIDDFIHTGQSMERAVRILQEHNCPILGIVTLLSVHTPDSYRFFQTHNIPIHSIHTFSSTPAPTLQAPYTPLWKFESTNPSLEYVVPKSNPVLDETHLYVGSDNREFWAIRQSDGQVAWSYRVGKPSKKKSIFSSPALYHDYVLFGSYDGNLYCLNKHTGALCWVFTEADWIGSSPSIADDLGLVFIGLEFGLYTRQGGIAALNIHTGRVVWKDYTHTALTHASPLYIAHTKEVVIGSNEGNIYLYDARRGTKKWTATTVGGHDYTPERDAGFGSGSIKLRPTYDKAHDYIITGSTDGYLYIVKRATGEITYQYHAKFDIWSIPAVHKNQVYFTSLDKHCYCLNLDNYTLTWKRNLDNTRIFASPTVIEGKLYIGTNASRLHELDLDTGESTGHLTLTERITNYPVYNKKTQMLFVPTYANEIVAYKKLEN